ncbi:VHS1064 protein [Vibrio phage 1]|nr:VHS1064 protein [Vibrio phage 1]
MKTTEQIKFVNREGVGVSPLRVIKLFQVSDPDNLNAVDKYNKEYYAANGSNPTTVTKAEVEAYAARLNEALEQSFSQLIRVYGFDKVKNLSFYSVQAKSVQAQTEKTETTTETVSVTGSTQLSTVYPITAISNIKLDLITKNGGKYTGRYELDDSGVIQLDEICFGYVTVTYSHKWLPVNVTGLDTTAKDKRPAMLLVTSDSGEDAINVTFPDVEDPESGITPDDKTYIKIWAHRGKNNRAVRDPLAVREFYEVTRTISPVEVDGVQIERALTVTMQEGEAGQNIRFSFDLPTT